MDFPEDWPLPMRRIVRAGDRKLRRWEDQHEEGAPLDKVARVGSQCLTKMRETLPELYEDEVPASWWARWQRGEIGREIYLLLCGENPRPMRENGEKHNYLRRVPTKNSNRNFRYIYDPKKAFPKTRKKPPRKQEKLLVTHAGKRGHYEVEAVEDGKAIVQHDETGHRMSIEGDKLYKLFKDANDTLQLSKEAEKRLTKLEKEDRLPRSRADAYYYIQQVSGIGDHDSAPNDVAYRKWKQGGKRGKKPPPMERDSMLDPFSGDKRRGKKGAKKPYSSLLEAFEDATKGAKTWRDILPAFEKLKEVPGFEEARLPDEVYERHALQDEILKEEVMSADPEEYGETLISTEEQEPESSEAPVEAGLVDEQGFDWSTGEQTYTDWTDEILNDPFYEDPI